jgi:hypothetical protein
METAYTQIEWTWQEYHGPYKVPKSKIVDRPYTRYPRTFIKPPSVELCIEVGLDKTRYIVGPTQSIEQETEIVHVVNVFLEIFGICQIFHDDLSRFTQAPIRRLNWRVLPPGRYPWERMKVEVDPLIRQAGDRKEGVVRHRIEKIAGHGPEFVAIGTAGFLGYLIFGFPAKNTYVLESVFTGNATYVFEENWERLSQLTKAEILVGGFQKDRIIHREGWDQRIIRLLAKVGTNT